MEKKVEMEDVVHEEAEVQDGVALSDVHSNVSSESEISVESPENIKFKWIYKHTLRVLPLAMLLEFAQNLTRPVIPALLLALVRKHYFSGTGDGDNNYESEISGTAAEWAIYLMLVGSFAETIGITIWAAVADRFGRKRMIIWVLLASSVQSAFEGYVAYSSLHPSYLFISRILRGFGPKDGFLVGTFSMIADVVPPKDRANDLTLLEGALLGAFPSALVGGIIMDNFGLWTPFATQVVLQVVVALSMLTVPETLKKEHRTKEMKFEDANVISSLSILWEKKPVILLMTIFFCYNMVFGGFEQNYSFYLYYVFDWTGTQVGGLASALSLYEAVMVVCLIRVVQHFCNESRWINMITIRIAWLAAIPSLLLFAFITIDWLWYLISFSFMAVSAISIVIRVTLSKTTEPSRQAQMMGAFSASDTLFGLSEQLITVVYSQTVTIYPAAMFFVLIGFSFIGLTLTFFINEEDMQPKYEEPIAVDNIDDEVTIKSEEPTGFRPPPMVRMKRSRKLVLIEPRVFSTRTVMFSQTRRVLDLNP